MSGSGRSGQSVNAAKMAAMKMKALNANMAGKMRSTSGTPSNDSGRAGGAVTTTTGGGPQGYYQSVSGVPGEGAGGSSGGGGGGMYRDRGMMAMSRGGVTGSSAGGSAAMMSRAVSGGTAAMASRAGARPGSSMSRTGGPGGNDAAAGGRTARPSGYDQQAAMMDRQHGGGQYGYHPYQERQGSGAVAGGGSYQSYRGDPHMSQRYNQQQQQQSGRPRVGGPMRRVPGAYSNGMPGEGMIDQREGSASRSGGGGGSSSAGRPDYYPDRSERRDPAMMRSMYQNGPTGSSPQLSGMAGPSSGGNNNMRGRYPMDGSSNMMNQSRNNTMSAGNRGNGMPRREVDPEMSASARVAMSGGMSSRGAMPEAKMAYSRTSKNDPTTTTPDSNYPEFNFLS